MFRLTLLAPRHSLLTAHRAADTTHCCCSRCIWFGAARCLTVIRTRLTPPHDGRLYGTFIFTTYTAFSCTRTQHVACRLKFAAHLALPRWHRLSLALFRIFNRAYDLRAWPSAISICRLNTILTATRMARSAARASASARSLDAAARAALAALATHGHV